MHGTIELTRTRVTAEIEDLARPRHEACDELVDGMRRLHLLPRADFSVSSKKVRTESWISKTCLKVVRVSRYQVQH